MTISMYAASAPRFVNMLRNLDAILAKAQDHAAAKKSDPAAPIGARDMRFKGLPYLVGFAWPNFYFHLVTAYNIPRHNGVDIGKTDYIGKP
ncbi:MAG: DUF1993 family protein [Sulfuritalea sp.]|nr:DUF1993 family protein [Sulfuritalea sp.]